MEFVNRVGSVADQLAKKNLLVGVDAVDHEIEQLLALCFELFHCSLLVHTLYMHLFDTNISGGRKPVLAVKPLEC